MLIHNTPTNISREAWIRFEIDMSCALDRMIQDYYEHWNPHAFTTSNATYTLIPGSCIKWIDYNRPEQTDGQ